MSEKNLTARRRPPGDDLLDVDELRNEFPILRRSVHGKPLVYLDNSATTQKPQCVIDALDRFYLTECSNIHRGLHELSALATEEYENARRKLQRFVGAASASEIIFTRGTTESINLVAHGWGDAACNPDDEILITEMEHHSNIVPWQMLCERTGARLRVVPIDDDGEIVCAEFERLLGPKTRLVSMGHVSNALGTRNPVEWVVERAHERGALVLLDGAQGIVHEPIDVGKLGCDFYAFSGHKMYGPTGIGGLYGRADLLESMQPFQGGGDMIHSVSFEKTTYADPPHRFEAGTPDVAGAIGLGAAVEFLERVGMERIAAHESRVTDYALQLLEATPKVRIVGHPRVRCGVISMVFDGVHPHDVGTVLDHEGVAVRAGHHCCQPLMERLGLPATVRASFACYNTRQEAEVLAASLGKVAEVFG